MPFYKTEIVAGKTIEIYRGCSKRYGASNTRGPNRERTKEEIEKSNRRNREKKLTRIINANFGEGDLHMILTWRRELRPSPEEAKKIVTKYLRKLRTEYRKTGNELKYVWVTEYKTASIHCHLVINNPENMNLLKLNKKLWPYGQPMYRALYDDGNYRKLAEYLVKETQDTRKDKNSGQKQSYSSSRNLIIPKPKVTLIKRSAKWHANPKPYKGYYIDEDTLVNGINGFNGQPYQSYTMIKIANEDDGKKRAEF